jgi:hypothetical protein
MSRVLSRRSLFHALCLAALPLALTACGADELFGPETTGNYAMTWVNGTRVPATVYTNTKPGSSYRMEVASGTLHLRHDDTFSLHLEIREFDGTSSVRSTQGYSGSYHRDGRDLFFYFVDPVTGRQRTLSGFVRDGYAEVLLGGLLDGQILQCGFEK